MVRDLLSGILQKYGWLPTIFFLLLVACPMLLSFPWTNPSSIYGTQSVGVSALGSSDYFWRGLTIGFLAGVSTMLLIIDLVATVARIYLSYLAKRGMS